MPRLFERKNNKSQASLDKIPDPRDNSQSQNQVHNIHNHTTTGQQGQSQGREPDTLYPPAQQSYGQQAYHTHSTSQQQQQTPQPQHQSHPPLRDPQQQGGLDERYYIDQPPAQPPAQQPAPPLTHPPHLAYLAHLLGPPSPNRAPPPANAYQEQQQLQPQRPSIALVNPNLQQESIAEDDAIQPGHTQFGSSQRIRTSGPKEEKKSRNGLRGFFGSSKDKKDGRDSPSDGRLSRTGSVLKKASQQYATQQHQQSSAQQRPHPSLNVPQTPTQPGRPESLTAYPQESSQEDLTGREDQRQYEQYYREQRPGSQQYESSQYTPQQGPPQDLRRPSVQYEEDAPHFPAPTQQQYYQHQQQQQIYHQPNISQPRLEVDVGDRKEFTPYSSQLPVRDRPSGLFEADHSLRPPSQSSLGPPSPLGNPPQLASRPSTHNTPRYSVQSIQAYQAAQEAASQIQDQSQGQSSQTQTPPPSHPHQHAQTPAGSGTPQHLQVQGAADQEEMPARDRDRQQRESRADEDSRYAAQQDPRVRMSTTEAGRNTPPPGRSTGREDLQSLDQQQLIAKYEELQAKYSKVKRYYFDREAQVTQLQNTVANQRLSMSKTSLDDAQYATRFERLNGAIQNLAFNIRKDWRRVPNWLVPACNRDACTTGTKEMTAVGRACISRWLYEHIFQEIFHPGIDPTLSAQLKQMERTLRRTPSILTDEQRDDLLTKVMTWRLTTCESLHDVLNSRQNEAYTETLSRVLADQLCEYLRTLLNDPAPPNLEGYLLPIVAQTLSISANLPLESRDICIEYYFPGTPFNDTFMKLESGMTPLVQPGSAPTREEYDEMDDEEEPRSVISDRDRDDIAGSVNPNIGTHSVRDVEEQIREAHKQATASSNNSGQPAPGGANKGKKPSGGLFGGSFGGAFIGTTKKPGTLQRSQGGAEGAKGKDGAELQKGGPGAPPEMEEHAWNFEALTRGQKEGKIRFAVFVAVEVRGKSPKSDGQNSAGSSGNGNGDGKADSKSTQGVSAGPGVGSNSGTSGGAGTGGINVLVKAPCFGF